MHRNIFFLAVPHYLNALTMLRARLAIINERPTYTIMHAQEIYIYPEVIIARTLSHLSTLRVQARLLEKLDTRLIHDQYLNDSSRGVHTLSCTYDIFQRSGRARRAPRSIAQFEICGIFMFS